MRKIITRVPRVIVHVVLRLYRVLAFLLEIVYWVLYLLNKIPFKVFSVVGTVLFSLQIGHRMYAGIDIKWLVVGVSFLAYLIAVALFKYVVVPLIEWISERVTADVNSYFPPHCFKYMVFKPDQVYDLFDEEELEYMRKHPDTHAIKPPKYH